ncbi:MAG: hypothetical protein H7Y13_10500 [Sphingobacteriaceae bacterium]|nr:hypothetical protein [Sphingobacteriaceae bacterium]
MKFFKIIFTVLIFALTLIDASAQIIINGRNPRRYNSSGPSHGVSLSYGNIFWVDGKTVPLKGSSASGFPMGDPFAIEKMNIAYGIILGYEKALSEKFAIKATFSTSKLITGLSARADLVTADESRFTQLGFYSRYTLTKEPKHRIQFQWLAGPEIIYVKKDVLVQDYAEDNGTPGPYRQDISIVEGAIVTGLGISCRISNAFSLFSDGMLGISLPGKGLKVTNSGFGLKYSW